MTFKDYIESDQGKGIVAIVKRGSLYSEDFVHLTLEAVWNAGVLSRMDEEIEAKQAIVEQLKTREVKHGKF